MNTKFCPRCEDHKPIDDFSRQIQRGKVRVKSLCKPCNSAYAAEWRGEHREKYNKYFRQRRATDPSFKERGIVYIDDWKKTHPEQVAVIASRASAKRRGATHGDVTASEWADRIAEFNGHCAYCIRPHVRLEQDHMQPISKNGPHVIANVIPACRSCNARKGARTLLEFLADSSTYQRDAAA